VPEFELVSPHEPCGDQPEAISALLNGLRAGQKHQVLLGATGTGKTFTMANVIAQNKRPTLVLAPNKTLAAQLYGEFKSLFPQNAVHYFVSYYDYYQPEAYVASSDMFIEKDALINDRIDKLRHASTRALLEREDLIIVSSISCIYGIGSPKSYLEMMLRINEGDEWDRAVLLRSLIDQQYQRNDVDFHRGTFRVRGDVIEIFPIHEDDRAIRLELFGDEVEKISVFDPLRGRTLESLERTNIYPASHYVTPKEDLEYALGTIEVELMNRLGDLNRNGDLLEAQRLEQRTLFDLEMLSETGHCAGIENYSRHLDQRKEGEPPATLLDYFPKEWLLMVDESHVAVPQIGGMYRGDRNRKETLVDYGFRLPSALDNRPLTFEEFSERVHQTIYVSATPREWELNESGGISAEQIIRPTGLLDPEVEIREASIQVDDLLDEVRKTAEKGERILVTVLTKRMAQELTDYYQELGVRARYLHSDIDTLERMTILRDLRKGEFDALIGINLLREGLDLPEVSLVAILDADREGFLRNTTSLIQTMGRAARNVNGRCILYADTMTRSMRAAIDETTRRRAKQKQYNAAHNITPETIAKAIESPLAALLDGDYVTVPKAADDISGELHTLSTERIPGTIKKLRGEMKRAAQALNFEKAAELRDRIKDLEEWVMEIQEP